LTSLIRREAVEIQEDGTEKVIVTTFGDDNRLMYYAELIYVINDSLFAAQHERCSWQALS
jgi:hypothetical protein